MADLVGVNRDSYHSWTLGTVFTAVRIAPLIALPPWRRAGLFVVRANERVDAGRDLRPEPRAVEYAEMADVPAATSAPGDKHRIDGL